jgi:YMGG-like Gly-zipper
MKVTIPKLAALPVIVIAGSMTGCVGGAGQPAALLSAPGAALGAGGAMPDNCKQNLDQCSQKVWERNSFPYRGASQSTTFSNHMTLTCTSNGPNIPRSCTLNEGQANEAPAKVYGGMPQYCTTNNTATGAIIGTLLGAGIGGATGGGRGAAIGAVSGLALGGLTGAQPDTQCRQLAYQKAMELAMAAPPPQPAAQQASSQPATDESVEYVTPSTGAVHKVTPVNKFSHPVTQEPCIQVKDVSFGPDGKESAETTGRVCRSADGTLHET